MIRIPSTTEREGAMWNTLLDLADRQQHWTLIGARMVQLHALEHRRAVSRVTVDADALADARVHPNPVRALAQILTATGFELVEPNAFGEAHTFVRDGVEIDVLAPEHLGLRGREARTTVPPSHTVGVPGGRQALARTERIAVRVGGRRGELPRPDLPGAILLKARAVAMGRSAVHRVDLALLLSLVDDPDRVATGLSRREVSWIRRRREMDDPDADCWAGLTRAQRVRGIAALRILSGA
jgi:hypothetical protein